MVDTLTAKQEGFVQSRFAGCNRSDAFRANYDTSKMTDKSVWALASKVDANVKVKLRLAALRAAVTDVVVQKRVWDLERVLERAEENLDGAQSDHQWASANGALEFIGKATGVVTQKPVIETVRITHVTTILDHGNNESVIEAEYKVLDPGADDAEAVPEA